LRDRRTGLRSVTDNSISACPLRLVNLGAHKAVADDLVGNPRRTTVTCSMSPAALTGWLRAVGIRVRGTNHIARLVNNITCRGFLTRQQKSRRRGETGFSQSQRILLDPQAESPFAGCDAPWGKQCRLLREELHQPPRFVLSIVAWFAAAM
jgi:hypothetical protein